MQVELLTFCLHTGTVHYLCRLVVAVSTLLWLQAGTVHCLSRGEVAALRAAAVGKGRFYISAGSGPYHVVTGNGVPTHAMGRSLWLWSGFRRTPPIYQRTDVIDPQTPTATLARGPTRRRPANSRGNSRERTDSSSTRKLPRQLSREDRLVVDPKTPAATLAGFPVATPARGPTRPRLANSCGNSRERTEQGVM
ncbi:Hypp4954 [Branchiostoma lanceolatum]|uniref:Hypp4954 protein n=1 Tax=Branchiostoma lanceolatum TaxID=7740 RepID=A0A8K0ADP6_BRALA|nr:Hypp4954 [Branchiostoma lanceolatum]